MSRRINQKGLDLLKRFEGCKLTPYLDQGGLITIGYGHTGPEVTWATHLTHEQAEQLLIKDLATAEDGVRTSVFVELTDNQFSALVSFAYNEGVHAFCLSTLRKLLNNSQYQDAADQFLRWDKVHGVSSKGLAARRKAERDLFLEV